MHSTQELRQAGFNARKNGEPAAPAANRTVIEALEAVEDKRVGNPEVTRIMLDFQQGWAAHEAQEMAGLGL